MPEVQRVRAHDQRLTADAGHVEAHGEIVIFQTPALVMLVKPVDALDIGAEQREVAAENFRLVAPGQTNPAQPGIARCSCFQRD